jgi:hypothetical protein
MKRERREDEYRREAERLALLPPQEQRQALARVRASAEDLGLSLGERAAIRERAAALEWLLQRLNGD